MTTTSHPVYVISKGRSGTCLTANFMIKDGLTFTLVVEPQEHDAYRAKYPEANIAVLPFSNLGMGSTPARNWVWEHSVAAGDSRHWIFDDNIRRMWRVFDGKRLRVESGPAISAMEDFVNRYTNVAVAGPCYYMFQIPGSVNVPFRLNCHVYSALLIDNAIPHRWRLRYNEDTDLCLQVLSSGLCTIQFTAFSIQKAPTMSMSGGNTQDLYADDGRAHMSRELERMWPGIVTTKRKWGRPQHHVIGNWRGFDTPLIRRTALPTGQDATPNEYGMRPVQVGSEIRSPWLRKVVSEADDRAGK